MITAVFCRSIQIWLKMPTCANSHSCNGHNMYVYRIPCFCTARNTAMSNGIIYIFFFSRSMFIDELFNSAKPVSMLLTVRNSHYKAQSKVYVALNKAAKPFWWVCINKQKQHKISCHTRKPKAALQEIKSRPES